MQNIATYDLLLLGLYWKSTSKHNHHMNETKRERRPQGDRACGHHQNDREINQ